MGSFLILLVDYFNSQPHEEADVKHHNNVPRETFQLTASRGG